MRAPNLSEPKSTFPTYQVPQESAMRGADHNSNNGASSAVRHASTSAAAPLVAPAATAAPPQLITHPQVQEHVAWAARWDRADPSGPARQRAAPAADPAPRGGPPARHAPTTSVIMNGSPPTSCCRGHNDRLRGPADRHSHHAVTTENNRCLLNSVTVPKIQRNDHSFVMVEHNNSDKLDSKFGALSLGRDIPNKKSDDLEVLDKTYDYDDLMNTPMQYNKQFKTNINNTDLDAFYLQQQQKTTGWAPPLRLRGGGESSLSAGTSGWGTPPSQQASNNNANWGSANPQNQNQTGTQQWNNNANRGPPIHDANKTNGQQPAQQPATSQSAGGWGQQPGNKPPVVGGVPPPGGVAPPVVGPPGVNVNNNGPAAANSTTTKQQLEQLNTMREAIFSPDGWGGQHVNQDTNWDIPSSPEPPLKLDGSAQGGGGPPAWKPPVNNGTELWEANLRNGGQPPPQPQQKTPWGHTPSTNIGGTWGEDDDGESSSNVWTGVPSQGGNNGPQQQQQQQWGAGGGNGNGTMWGGPKKPESEWGSGNGNNGGGGGGGSNWGDPRSGNVDPRQSMDPRDMRPDHLRDMRSGNNAGDQMRMMDPREQMRQMAGGNGEMRGDPRGITGRLNAPDFWPPSGGHPGQGNQHMGHPGQGKMPMGGPGNGAGGWEEPSPPSQRRNMPSNYDDGTALWGNPQPQGSHWKDMPSAGAGMGGRGAPAPTGGPPGMAQSRVKQEGGVWAGHGRNSSWDEMNGWDEGNSWGKQKMPPGQPPLWGAENELDWGHKGPKHQPTKEMVWNSKPFKVLVDMGYKKEDVENALRLREMNMEEALEMLSAMRGSSQDGWRTRHDDHYDHPQFQNRFPPGGGHGGQMSFPGGGQNNPPNLMNNVGGGNPNSSLINSISPNVVSKMLSQNNSGVQGFGNPSAARAALPQQTQPSTQQLRMLVQQIQMAVQAGYLNHQILNQPLAPQTLVLLNQLLQQIKNLQQLGNQHALAQSSCINGKPSSAFLQSSVLITKTKQQITNLQNQIAAQQAIYVKQQHGGGGGLGGPDVMFKTGMHDGLNSLQSNFGELAIKDPQVNQQQSRLNQWINKDKEDGNEFSRAPGSTSKPMATSPNMNPLGGLQADGPWSSSGRTGGDTGWPDSGGAVIDGGVVGGDNSQDVKDAQWSTAAQPSLTDLVPEFEPGKPWKGNQIKSIEDDPSITPGSVARSPLSMPTLKDSDLFLNPSKSPPAGGPIPPLSLGSSTWSFNPTSAAPSAFTSPQTKLPTNKNSLTDPTTAVTADLWGAPKARGPPPGLPSKSNGWTTNLSGATASWGGSAGAQRGSWSGSTSCWLLLRNLTAQIDGSTLRTLCMQHGPLQRFQLYLNQSFALAKYSTCEEATKAQTALNNCVLGNTTILAENPSDWEANSILQQMTSSQSSNSGGWRGSNSGNTAKQVPGSGGGDTWSTGWSNNPSSANLWATTPLDTADQSRATPSSLNSYLPNDLLGGESM